MHLGTSSCTWVVREDRFHCEQYNQEAGKANPPRARPDQGSSLPTHAWEGLQASGSSGVIVETALLTTPGTPGVRWLEANLGSTN
jgi:hypothetical protein